MARATYRSLCHSGDQAPGNKGVQTPSHYGVQTPGHLGVQTPGNWQLGVPGFRPRPLGGSGPRPRGGSDPRPLKSWEDVKLNRGLNSPYEPGRFPAQAFDIWATALKGH